MRSLLKRLDTVVLAAISLIAIIVVVVHFFHLVSAETLNPAVPSLVTLFFLALMAIHLIVSRVHDDEFQQRSDALLERISKGISLAEFQVFTDPVEMEHYLAERVLKAKKSVCDLSWKSKISAGFNASHRQISHGTLDRCIAESAARISYREIFIFNDPRRIERMERRLSENKDGYSCRYYKDDTRIPRLQFVIVDDEEVFFFASSAHSHLCSMHSPELCHVFKPYFDEAWDCATPIKEGPTIHEKELDKIRKLFPTAESKTRQ